MGVFHCITLELSMMRDEKSLTRHWQLFLRGGSDIVTTIFARKGGQYYDYGSMPLHGP